MPEKRFLTDRFLRALLPAKRGHITDIWCTSVSGFGIRIYDAADPARRGKALKANFILYSRFGGRDASPSRRVIGSYPAIGVAEARQIAVTWRSLIDRDIDPRVVEQAEAEKIAREAALRIKHSFAAVVEEFVIDKLKRERSGRIAERDLRNVFVSIWGERLITDITEDDVLAIVMAKKRRAPEQARAMLILIKRFFG